jgi:hypothetical protein
MHIEERGKLAILKEKSIRIWGKLDDFFHRKSTHWRPENLLKIQN